MASLTNNSSNTNNNTINKVLCSRRMPAPDNVRPLPPQQQQPGTKSDADIMGGLMEGGSIGSMGMPAGGMVMTGQNAPGKLWVGFFGQRPQRGRCLIE